MANTSDTVIRILKRPSNSTNQMNGINIKPQPVIKSLQQRELEYAEARLRIFGNTENEEETQNSQNRTQSSNFPKQIVKSTQENVVRHPKGPDGTQGFNVQLKNSMHDNRSNGPVHNHFSIGNINPNLTFPS